MRIRTFLVKSPCFFFIESNSGLTFSDEATEEEELDEDAREVNDDLADDPDPDEGEMFSLAIFSCDFNSSCSV